MGKYQWCGIYKLMWEDGDGYFYYGQSINMRTRAKQHFSRMRNGKHENTIIQRLYNKYGLPEVVFVFFCKPSQLDKKEQKLLDTFGNLPDNCNINLSVFHTTKGLTHTPEVKALLRKLKLGRKLSESHKGRIGKGLLKAYQNGRAKPNLFGRNNPFFNKTHSAESLAKMNGHSKNTGANNIKARLTLDLSTGIYYDYAGEAAIAKGYNPNNLSRMLSGTRRNSTTLIYA